MKVRKQISIDNKVLEKGLIKADELFGGNFSIYVAYLINKDTNYMKEKMEGITEYSNKLDDEVKNEVDDILNL